MKVTVGNQLKCLSLLFSLISSTAMVYLFPFSLVLVTLADKAFSNSLEDNQI